MEQKIVHIQEFYYSDLVNSIEKEMDECCHIMEVQQIDYFNMDLNSGGLCHAIILFKSKKQME